MGAVSAFAVKGEGAVEEAGACLPETCPMAVCRLRLSDFRCYDRLNLEFSAGPVVLTGPNGAGKTNILEALSFLVPGRGLRRSRLSDVARRDTQGVQPVWGISAGLMTPEGLVTVGTGCGESGPAERRSVRIDGATSSQNGLGQLLAMVWITPSMDRLFLDGAGTRRRFLDRLTGHFDAAHRGRVMAYTNALRQRARLLKEGRGDAAWLDALEETMATKGVAVTAARRDTISRLQDSALSGGNGFPAVSVDLLDTVDDWLAEGPALMAEDRLREEFKTTREADSLRGGASVGPHLADFQVRDKERDLPAEQGSTGEQKAFLLSLILAHARALRVARGTPPVLLMDEVVAHLDATRRHKLFEMIAELNMQVFMTGTDMRLFAGLTGSADFFRVEAAAVRPITPPHPIA